MINLLPPKRLLNIKIARSNTVLRRYVELILIGMVIVGAAVIAAYYFLNTQQSNVKNTLTTNQEKLSELSKVQKEAEELSATVNTISGLLSRNVKFSEMLTRIGGTMPDGAVLTGLQFSIENTNAPLTISAEVENEERAAVLRNNLLTSGLFKTVNIKSINLIKQAESSNEESETETETEETPVPDVANTSDERYRYTAVLDAYLKELGE